MLTGMNKERVTAWKRPVGRRDLRISGAGLQQRAVRLAIAYMLAFRLLLS